jgi:aldehyde dehydrogenase
MSAPRWGRRTPSSSWKRSAPTSISPSRRARTSFRDEDQALEIANDTLYELGAGVWTRNGNLAYRMGRAIHAGRVWTNCYHMYPAGAAFGGYKMSGVGRELAQETLTHHYTQTKNLFVSYSDQAQGLF